MSSIANDDYLSQYGFQMTFELENNLIHGADIGIKYFDQRINPNTDKSLIDDIKTILTLKSELHSESSAASFVKAGIGLFSQPNDKKNEGLSEAILERKTSKNRFGEL